MPSGLRDVLTALRKNVRSIRKMMVCEPSVNHRPEHSGGSTGDERISSHESLCLLLLVAAALMLRNYDSMDAATNGLDGQTGGREGKGKASTNELMPEIKRINELVQHCAGPDIGKALTLPRRLSEKSVHDIALALSAFKDSVEALDECAFGYMYQFFNESLRQDSLKRLQCANKTVALDDLVAFTQLYTPSWVADYLISSAVITDVKTNIPTILDPSCGSGHFLLRAFDFLANEDSQIVSKNDLSRDRQIIEALHGCDIDAIALWVTALSLVVKLLKRNNHIESDWPRFNLQLLDDAIDDSELPLGALSREYGDGHMLSQKFDAVIGNPPYIGRKLIDRRLKTALRQLYPEAHQDLCTAFMARGLELLNPGGRLAYITQTSMLYLPTYSKFRRSLLESYKLVEVVEAGTQVFPLQTGEKINSMLIVIENACPKSGQAVLFHDLRSAGDKEQSLQELHLRRINKNGAPATARASASTVESQLQRQQADFLQNARFAINFHSPSSFSSVCKNAIPLAELAEIKQGLATSDNERFIKFWWQVPEAELGQRWIPYVKGSGCERWYSPVETVVDWGMDGTTIKQAVAAAYPYLNGKTEWVVKNERYYFREGLTFSFVNSREFAVRYLPPGCIFDVAGSALFPVDPALRNFLLAYLNSSFINAAASWINPTINFQVGDLKQLPVLRFSDDEKRRLSELANICVTNKQLLIQLSGKEPGLSPQSKSSVHKPECDLRSPGPEQPDRIAQIITNSEQEIDRIVLACLRHTGINEDGFRDIATRSNQRAAQRRASIYELARQ